MSRFRLTLEYAGTRYRGWQKQKNARTVQGALEDAIAEALQSRDFDCQGSGRTDAGVHALMQVAHLDARISGSPDRLRERVNEALPADIVLLKVALAPHRFHARHSAVERSYLYQIARRKTAFAKPFVWWVKESLRHGSMQDAAACFVGMHDFRSFSDDDPDDKSTMVLVNGVDVVDAGDLRLVRVTGSHFLWKMVRRMVGVLVEVGRGTLTPVDVERLLTHPSDVPARLTAPASGLFLERVRYDGDPLLGPVVPATPVWSVDRWAAAD